MFGKHSLCERRASYALLLVLALWLSLMALSPARVVLGARQALLQQLTLASDGTSLTTITTTADQVDGATTSLAALNANQGPDGVVSLREALLATEATPDLTPLTIRFAIPLTDTGYVDGVWTIRLNPALGALPTLARGGVIIDGSTQPGSPAALALDGGNNIAISNGLTISSSDNIVRALTIQHFYDEGVLLAGQNVRENQVVGCIIHHNGDDGILMVGNQVAGNQVIDTHVLNNYGAGVELRDGPFDNIIGGLAVGNVISGNGYYGVLISGPQTQRNTVAGNWVGLDLDGRTARANAFGGVRINDAYAITIGGSAQGAGNVISGNDSGISIEDSDSNTVAGNIIGLAADSLTPLGNADGGIFIRGGSSGNLIGGSLPHAGNVIASNGILNTPYGQGIYITDAGSDNNRILGNYIGVQASRDGTAFGRGNYSYGVQISFNARDNLIGGTGAGEANVIGYNGLGGIRIDSQANQVAGNLIGVGPDGQTPLGNQNNGVRVRGDANLIGPANLIAYSALSGIMLMTGQNNQVISNTLIYNARSGICINSPNTTVSGNIVRDNGQGSGPWSECNIRGGIAIENVGNAFVGDNAIYANGGVGVTVRAGTGNRVLTNSISGNSSAGIELEQGGNNEIAPPVISAFTNDQIQGRGCPGCRVEVFADASNEGRYFIGMALADAEGNFQLPFNSATVQAPYVTATQTDASGNTSAFALPMKLPSVSSPSKTPTTVPGNPTATPMLPTPQIAPAHRILLPLLARNAS